jgi:hypothetical protein
VTWRLKAGLAESEETSIARQLLGKHVSVPRQNPTTELLLADSVFCGFGPRLYNILIYSELGETPVRRRGWSTITLRVVGGDEKGSLESETVNYDHESRGCRTRKCLRWRGPGAILNDIPVLSSETASTSTNQQLSDSNKNLVVSPRWVLYSKTDWPTNRRS